jgi:lysophospholipase L1-like esterase
MNTDFNSGGFLYKAVAFAIILVITVLIIIMTVSSPKISDKPATNTSNDANVNQPSITETTFVPITTAPVTEPQQTSDLTTDTSEPETSATEQLSQDTTAPDTNKPVEIPTGNTPDEIAEYLAKYPDTVLGPTEDAGQEYIDKLVFLGDSTTYGLRFYKKLSGGKETTQVWTPTNGTLTLSQASFAKILYPETNTEITIKEAVEAKKPEYLVITLGVNGVSFMGEEFFKSEYKKLIKSVQETSPETKIICQSIFPVARSYKNLKSINNNLIDTANRWICEVAAECGVKYIDTNSVLRDEEGWLPESYHNGDGMHLNSDSFTLELNNLRTHAYLD